MKTITVKGFEYEIGELYMNEAGLAGYLVRHVNSVYNGGFVLQCGGAKYSTCTITKIDRVGEITKVKAKLVYGECYKFEHPDSDYWMFGEYFEAEDVFNIGDSNYRAVECTNIRLMKEA